LEEVIRVEDLWFTYPGGVEALRGISLSIYKGEFIGLVGQNGSGKTTLVKHFNGLLKPTKGRVVVFGVDTRRSSTASLSKKVGYVFQNPDSMLFGRTVLEEVSFALKNMGVPREKWEEIVRDTLGKLDLDVPLKANPHLLSMGQRHRIAIADVLVMNPEVLILDEPTTGLDYKRCIQLMETVKKIHGEGKTVILITHDISLVARYVDRVIVLKDGSLLADGDPHKILSDVELLIKSNLVPPQITLLAQRVRDLGFSPETIRVEEMVQQVLRLVGGPTT